MKKAQDEPPNDVKFFHIYILDSCHEKLKPERKVLQSGFQIFTDIYFYFALNINN